MAANPLPLPIWGRQAQKRVNEFMDDSQSTYESQPRRSFNQLLESHPLYDWMLAAYQHSRRSARKIAPFIGKHKIDMSEFEPVQYRSYAEFFERRFRAGVRSFPPDPGTMGAFAEARYFAWQRVAADQRFPIKGASLDAAQILGGAELARSFAGGPVLLARLAPVDYHHVHYCDDGQTLQHAWEGHRLWTVNWHALQNKPDILFRNERRINILPTKNFGRIGLSRPALCRSDASCRFIRLTSPFTEAKRNPCSGSAVRQSSCSAKRTRGAQRRTSSKTHGRELRLSYASAMRSRDVDRLIGVVPVRLVRRMTSPTGGPVRPPRPCPDTLLRFKPTPRAPK
jgi:phosphatidylserine decarboxylase